MDVRDMSPMMVAMLGMARDLELANEQDNQSPMYDDQLM